MPPDQIQLGIKSSPPHDRHDAASSSELVYRESNDLNKQVKGFVNRRTGHGYQAVDGALDYYLAEL